MQIRAGLLDLFANGYDNAIIDVNVDIAEYIFAKKCLKNDVEKSGRTSACTSFRIRPITDSFSL